MAEEYVPKGKSIPELELKFGFYLWTEPPNRDGIHVTGDLEWGTYRPSENTPDPVNMFKLALQDILKNPRLHSLFFSTGGIWMKLLMYDTKMRRLG